MLSNWSFAGIWNDSLLTYGERKIEPRDYAYASELGGAMIDRYLKMLGTKPTNPPNNRSLRKFQSGNIWEWIIGHVLERSGVLKRRQIRSEVTLDNCVRVSGKLDFIAGGAMDFERAKVEMAKLHLPEFLEYATSKIIEQLKAKHNGEIFTELILENKAVSSFVFERIMRTKRANLNHILQNFHYLLGTQYKVGKINYICKDDCRLWEFDLIKESPDIFQEYYNDVKLITDYYRLKELPPKEKEVLFDEGTCRFNTNYKVEYSYYLSRIYGYKTPQDYRDKYGKVVSQFNRVFRRCVEDKKMTDDNKNIIKIAKKMFPKWDDYVEIAKASGVLQMVVEEELD